eukprot:6131350-Pyramimonas_sp.AAC.1
MVTSLSLISDSRIRTSSKEGRSCAHRKRTTPGAPQSAMLVSRGAAKSKSRQPPSKAYDRSGQKQSHGRRKNIQKIY